MHLLAFTPGSPPQVRGKPRSAKESALADGITPAGAGKTRLQRRINMLNEDHPRRCGENSLLSAVERLIEGSPPQVRGKLFERYILGNWVRITPAGAGKTALIGQLFIFV